MKPLALVLLALAAVPAAAHEVVSRVERGRAVSVRAQYSDGEPLANAVFEVFSPADAEAAHVEGLTDRNGWLAFVPDAPGAWRVTIREPDGHGIETVVDVPAPGVAATTSQSSAPSALGFALRPVFGLAVLALVFAALFAFARRRASRR
jgi:nickel transport protein